MSNPATKGLFQISVIITIMGIVILALLSYVFFIHVMDDARAFYLLIPFSSTCVVWAHVGGKIRNINCYIREGY